MSKEKRRRRDTRRTDPPSISLQRRDVDIIEAVHKFRVLRLDQIQALFFGPTGYSAAKRRCRLLFDHAYLFRHVLPVVGGHGSSPTCLVLDKKGAELLHLQRGYDMPVWYNSRRELKTDFIEHTLAIADFMVAVMLACRQTGFELEKWIADSELKADYDRVTIYTQTGRKESVAVIPDSYFTIIAHKQRFPFFLELDRGTMDLGRFKNKIRAYLAYHKTGAYEKRYRTRSLRVLTVTEGERRTGKLKAATEEITGKITKEGWFWFATLALLTPETVLTGASWQQAGSEERKILIQLA